MNCVCCGDDLVEETRKTFHGFPSVPVCGGCFQDLCWLPPEDREDVLVGHAEAA